MIKKWSQKIGTEYYTIPGMIREKSTNIHAVTIKTNQFDIYLRTMIGFHGKYVAKKIGDGSQKIHVVMR